MQRIAFLGLGNMGFPMAGHLVKSGHQVTAWNRTVTRANSWLKMHPEGNIAATAAKAIEGCDVVFSCLGDDPDLRAVLLGEESPDQARPERSPAAGVPEGAFAHMAPGSLWVDHTTASAEIARELGNRAHSLRFSFMDAPVSGGQAGAENAKLTIMCGANKANFDRAKGLLKAYAIRCTLIGPVGSGQLAKSVNQICIAGVLQGLAEGIAFGEKAGLPMDHVLATIQAGAAGSWQMENRGATMCEKKFDFGFAVDWMRKDLRIALAEARNQGVPLPITALIDQFYAHVQADGGGRYDSSSLILHLSPDKRPK